MIRYVSLFVIVCPNLLHSTAAGGLATGEQLILRETPAHVKALWL